MGRCPSDPNMRPTSSPKRHADATECRSEELLDFKLNLNSDLTLVGCLRREQEQSMGLKVPQTQKSPSAPQGRPKASEIRPPSTT